MFKILQKAIKHRYLLSWLIAFFIGGVLFSFKCKASALPSNNTFTVMENTVEELFNFGFVPQSLLPYGDISTTAWTPWQVGGALLTFDLNDCEITELNDSQKSDLLSNWTIVNTSNINVTTSDTIYSVKMDNGYFTGYCYIDENGNILSYTNDLGGQLLQVKFGGAIKSSEDWDDLLSSTATQIYDANFNLYDNPSQIQGDTSYYLFIGSDKYSRPYVAQELYIANQYQPGVVVPVATSNGTTITSWYTNNLNLFNYKMVYGDDLNWKSFRYTFGTYSKNNISYTYEVQFAAGSSNTNTYQNWQNGIGPVNCTFAKYGTTYSTTLASNSSSSVAFKPLQLPEGSTIINYNYYYDPTEISKLEQELNNLNSTLNNNFNSSQQLSDENFPFYYPTNNTDINPSEIPFPNVVNYPNYNPSPSFNTNPSLDYGAISQPSNQSILDSFSNLQIPFLQNVRYRFPFCIPWDIRDALSLLKFSPTAPAWDFDWEITALGTTYTYHCVGDLSDYDSLAILFRRLMLIAVFIGLAFWTYKLML